MVLEDEVSCVVDRLYVYVSVVHDVGVGQSCSKGKGITALTENSSKRRLFYETAITKRHGKYL